MRHLQLVGVIKNKAERIVSRCGWCRRWRSIEDYIAAHRHGAKVSHGCCPTCSEKMMAELSASGPTRGDAA